MAIFGHGAIVQVTEDGKTDEMLNPEVGRQYWFVQPGRRANGDVPGEPKAVVPYIRQSYVRTVSEGDLERDSDPVTGSANIPFWGTALRTLYTLGFYELEEARAAGLIPPDWQVDADTPAWFSPIKRSALFERVTRNNLTCRRIADDGPICPHCANAENIRFIDKLPQLERLMDQQLSSFKGQDGCGYHYDFLIRSYFICSACARSFGQFDPEEIQTIESGR